MSKYNEHVEHEEEAYNARNQAHEKEILASYLSKLIGEEEADNDKYRDHVSYEEEAYLARYEIHLQNEEEAFEEKLHFKYEEELKIYEEAELGEKLRQEEEVQEFKQK
jgi:hypothetical protein